MSQVKEYLKIESLFLLKNMKITKEKIVKQMLFVSIKMAYNVSGIAEGGALNHQS
jgi:hypothetical protein